MTQPLTIKSGENHRPEYRNPELGARAQEILSTLQGKLKELGIECELTDNWYYYVLAKVVHKTDAPGMQYTMVKAFEVRPPESQPGTLPDKLSFGFDLVHHRMYGLLFNEIVIEEGSENFMDAMVAAAQKQNEAVLKILQLRSDYEKKEAERKQNLSKLRQEFPAYADMRSHVNAENEIQYIVEFSKLTEYQLRTLIRLVESGAIAAKDPNAKQEEAQEAPIIETT